MFPSVRLKGVDALLERIGSDAAHEDLDRLADTIDEAERRRLLGSFVCVYADRWESLIAAAGDVDAAERALVAGALEVALHERAATETEAFAEMERVWAGAPPYALLSHAIPPMFVWSLPEAQAARAGGEGRNVGERMKAVQEVGCALVTYPHRERVRVLAGRIAGELPFPRLPRVSRGMEKACDGVLRSVDARREAAVALLIAYVEQQLAAEAVLAS